VIAPAGRIFYVSPRAVYVWATEWRQSAGSEVAATRATSTAFRLPLDGSAPSALGVWASPIDQYSFLESEDGYVNVLVRADGTGDAMWSAEKTRGSIALLRVPVARFGDGRDAAEASRYRTLPAVEGYMVENRFVGDRLLYGAGNGWGAPKKGGSQLHVVPLRGGAVTTLSLAHGVDRIEAMGSDAVVVGTDGRNLRFSGIRLDGRPAVEQRFTLPGAAQGELRSQGFFYKPDGAGSGLIGLPVRGSGEPGYKHLIEGSASILFLRNVDRRFDALGTLAARDPRESNEEGIGDAEDGCLASCVDWYGNARPLFFRGRVFALLGYELVEGRVERAGIREVRRASFAPPTVKAVKRD